MEAVPLLEEEDRVLMRIMNAAPGDFDNFYIPKSDLVKKVPRDEKTT